METRRDVFQAIADPTRREIINLIARKSLNLNSIAVNFDMSRPAISQHIKILTECGLIVIKKHGRERFCEAKLQPLSEVSSWIEQYRRLWEGRLNSLDSLLKKMQASPPVELIGENKLQRKRRGRSKEQGAPIAIRRSKKGNNKGNQ